MAIVVFTFSRHFACAPAKSRVVTFTTGNHGILTRRDGNVIQDGGPHWKVRPNANVA